MSSESNQIFGYIWAALSEQRNHFKSFALDRKMLEFNLLFEGSEIWVRVRIEDQGV